MPLARADYAPLAAQFLLAERAYGEALAIGMHNSVVCAEDVPFWETRTIDRGALAATYMGTAQLDGLAAMCDIWPHGPVDADLHAPLTSDGAGADPVRQRRSGHAAGVRERGGARFPHGLTLTLAGFGHGQLTAPCMDACWRSSSTRASVAGLDAQLHAARGAAAVLHLRERSRRRDRGTRAVASGSARWPRCARSASARADGRITGLLGPERRRQVDHAAHAVHRAAPGRGRCADRRPQRGARRRARRRAAAGC